MYINLFVKKGKADEQRACDEITQSIDLCIHITIEPKYESLHYVHLKPLTTTLGGKAMTFTLILKCIYSLIIITSGSKGTGGLSCLFEAFGTVAAIILESEFCMLLNRLVLDVPLMGRICWISWSWLDFGTDGISEGLDTEFWLVGLLEELCCGILELFGVLCCFGVSVTNPTLRCGGWVLGVHPSLFSLATGGFAGFWFVGLQRFRCGMVEVRDGCGVTKQTLCDC